MLIHLPALSIRGVRVVWRIGHLTITLIHHATGTAVLPGNLAVGRLVANWRQLRADTASVGRRLSLRRIGRTGSINLVRLSSLSGGSTFTLLSSFTLGFFLLLSSFPFLADFFKFCGKG